LIRDWMLHTVSTALLAWLILPALGSAEPIEGSSMCPGNFGDLLGASQPNCFENSQDCANASSGNWFWCCLTHEGGCCQYSCSNWTCQTGCWVQIGGIRIGILPLLCYTSGWSGTSRVRVTDHPMGNADCVDPPGVCQARE
jgi:hypothetical protein